MSWDEECLCGAKGSSPGWTMICPSFLASYLSIVVTTAPKSRLETLDEALYISSIYTYGP
jgi:hypothetical protein